MNLDDILNPLIAFFSDGIGKVIADIGRFLYALLYPANAEPATPVVIEP